MDKDFFIIHCVADKCIKATGIQWRMRQLVFYGLKSRIVRPHDDLIIFKQPQLLQVVTELIDK